MTVRELKQEAKRQGIRGYSKMRKAELIERLELVVEEKYSTVKELRAEAKRRGLRGYSRLSRAALLKLLNAQPKTDDQMLVEAIAALPTSLSETRAVYKYLAGNRTKPVLDIMNGREYRGAQLVRDQQTTQQGWSRWNTKLAVLAGYAMA